MIIMLILVGLLFVLVGLGMLLARLFGGWRAEEVAEWRFWVFEFFALIIGGAIVVSQMKNLVFPFVMLKIDDDGIYVGTGWRYSPFFIPWQYIKGAEISEGGFPLLKIFKNCDSLIIRLISNQEIPGSMATSTGISYVGWQVTLDGNYTDRPAAEGAAVINDRIKEKNIGIA